MDIGQLKEQGRMSGTPDCSDTRPIFDCFIDRDGVAYICQVYDASDGYINDFGVYPLNDDGTKGEGVLEDGFEEEVQTRYREFIEQMIEDDAI